MISKKKKKKDETDLRVLGGSEIPFVQKDNAARQILTYTTQLNWQPTNCKKAVIE